MSTHQEGKEVSQLLDEMKCEKCGAEITTGAMALFCEHGKDCEFWVPEVEEFKADLEPVPFGGRLRSDREDSL